MSGACLDGPLLGDLAAPAARHTAERRLSIAVGQCSDAGRKHVNQDFHGAYVPKEPLLTTKGCVIAIADGISSSDVSRAASETAVGGFIADYYSTPEPWSVKTSGYRVLRAINSWLHAQTRDVRYAYDRDKGYVCTLSVLVVKSRTAHVFHVGDARIYRLSGGALEQLTDDHRTWVTRHESYLGAALGADEHVEVDYSTFRVDKGDLLLLVTDGVYEHVDARFMADAIRGHGGDLDAAARSIVGEAYAQGSPDNLSAQIVRIEDLPEPDEGERLGRLGELPFAPALDAGTTFDGYRIVRQVHASSRSHVYLAVDEETGARVALKTPSTEMRLDPDHLERLLAEEWVARRVDSPHVAKAFLPGRKRNYLYTVMEFIDGQTLTQWMLDHPEPDLATVRDVVEQIARGLRTFHRLEMMHRDLRPDNVMIDTTGTVKLVDFGSTRVAGLVETAGPGAGEAALGTAQYSAPECLLGERGSTRSDIFSLGVVAYQMLTGRLPYGTRVAKARSVRDHRRLRYTSVLNFNRSAPAWIDVPLKKALHPDPDRRYEALSELVFDLRRPRREFLDRARAPLLERNPVGFWRGVSLVLAITAAVLAIVLVS